MQHWRLNLHDDVAEEKWGTREMPISESENRVLCVCVDAGGYF